MKETLVKLLMIAFFIPQALICQSDKKNAFYVAQFNIENLFDAIDDPNIDDAEFLPESDKFWTDGKINAKLTNLAKVINFMNKGFGPDVFAVEEVENFNMMKRLCYAMRDRDYIPVHRDSKDARGIDVGLIYDRNIFEIEEINTIDVKLPNGYPTRDILHAVLKHKTSSEIIHFFVNHWPSRRGGKEKSNVNREAAAKTLRKAVDVLLESNSNANVVILGDFNDGPLDESLTKVLKAGDFNCGEKQNKGSLLNLAYKKASQKEGSYLFARNWDMIDQIIVSASFSDGKKLEYDCDSYEIIKPAFMIIHGGDREGGALPTYMGTKYVGGFSDHFPVGARFILKAE